MAHLIEELDTVLTVGEKAWHGLDDNRKFANLNDVRQFLDYPVFIEPVYLLDGTRVENRSATFTVDNGKKLTFTTVSDDYKVYQNGTALDILQPYEDAGCNVNTAGTLKNKAIAWVQLDLPGDDLNIGGVDPIQRKILFSNSHDGSASIRLGLTLKRVVCANTLSMAHDARSNQLIRVFHSGDVNANVQAIADMIDIVNQQLITTAERFNQLAKQPISSKDLKRVVKIAFSLTKAEQKLAEEETEDDKLKRVVSQIEEAFEIAPGQDLPSAKGTAWGLYNSITYYLTHKRGRTEGARLHSNWFGQNAAISKRALNASLELIKV